MRTTKGRRTRRNRQAVHLGKPHGVIAPRVQVAGPEHFGILAIDPAKARSYAMLADFYGRVLIPVTVVEHTQHGFQKAVAELRQAITTHGLQDLVVAIEQTGAYHRPIQHAYAAAGFEARIVHPSISRHFREAGAYDNKTDPTDLEGIFRAAINGLGLQQPTWRSDLHRLATPGPPSPRLGLQSDAAPLPDPGAPRGLPARLRKVF